MGHCTEYCPFVVAGQVTQPRRSPGSHPLRGAQGSRPARPALFLGLGELVQIQGRDQGYTFSAARQPPGPRAYTWGDPQTPPPLALSSCHASLDYISLGTPGSTGAGPLDCWGEGPARAAPLSQCRALQGGHVPLFGAFVRTRGCWCSVRPGGSDRAGGFRLLGGAAGCEREALGGMGWAPLATPCRRAAGGAGVSEEQATGRGRSALCVARAEPGLCPHSLGARLSWGRGAASWASPGR